MARLSLPRRADLHVHSTASDGEFTPSQVVAYARQADLCAVALTDHDTLAGYAEACETAKSLSHPGIEVVPAVEITTSFHSREFHLLGYFVDPEHDELHHTLVRLCNRRRERFHDYLVKLRDAGHDIPADRAELLVNRTASLGRRHVAELLLACGLVKTRNEAFHRFLGPLRGTVVPKELLPIAEAIALVRAAGGVTSLAHPPPDLSDEQFAELASFGLDAIESEYAWKRSSPRTHLRGVANHLGLHISGGSDCHGPFPVARRIGTYSVSADALEKLRARCDRSGSAPRSSAVVTAGC